MKNKNKEEKIENLKKNNIQKCIQICEKFKIPYNKFAEKVNIFLQGHTNLHENVGDQENVANIFLNPSTRANLNEVQVLSQEDENKDECHYDCIDHIIKNIIEKIIDDV